MYRRISEKLGSFLKRKSGNRIKCLMIPKSKLSGMGNWTSRSTIEREGEQERKRERDDWGGNRGKEKRNKAFRGYSLFSHSRTLNLF